ncbi:MAG: class I SAM-dependent methyltransferase [Gemmatimonadetes bacterium]|nr:class I SAM-dependent methyltransferase [Gemmatimonadota bacterium]NNM03988.1 class I SAM-dependent methyltransferase [Gemmatimonadota bacterium]
MSPSPDGRTDPRFAKALLQRDDAFRREDESADASFYQQPRLVSHLDRTALNTVERLVAGLIVEDDPVVLDLMASVDSHLPSRRRFSKVTGLGMNEEELRANPSLTDWVVKDLNADPTLPFADGTFDVVLNVVSVEYLTRPVEVFEEVGRVLKPGGIFLVVFSTRWFPPKVVRVWEDAREEERLGIVEAFFRDSGAFASSEYFISMGLPRPEDDRYFSLGVPSDPIFAVFAEKKGLVLDRRNRLVLRDPAQLDTDWAAVQARKEHVGETMECPHCQQRLSKWEVPDDPCIDWPNDFLYLCFNDFCPFVVRGWRYMWNQGILGTSYRYLYNPLKGTSTTVPIRGLADLRPGIVEEDPAGRFRSAIEAGLVDFSALPEVDDYGPDLGPARG